MGKSAALLAEMDVIAAVEESYAAMKRSTNGGGENSPMLEAEDAENASRFAGAVESGDRMKRQEYRRYNLDKPEKLA
ncbi:MAG: hypothetical protein LUI87_08085 [Lachnospiraceae bacterium]|nr:hypothetical protein [Lachnospiraceae bacterium]